MFELVYELQGYNPKEFYGPNNHYFQKIKDYYPKIKFHGRDNVVTLQGDQPTLRLIESQLDKISDYIKKYNKISERDLEQIILNNSEVQSFDSEVIVHGVGGKTIKAKTKNLKKLVTEVNHNDMVFAVGPAGTGKTYTSVALAVRALKNKEVKRIILTRPAVEAGESLGFLPGDLKEKLDPYLQPLYDALRDMITPERLSSYLEKGIVEVAPLAFMRGRTLDNAFVILDEAQNTTGPQMKMFLTRMGESAKFIITGDPTQIDLPRNQNSGLKEAINILKNVKGIGFVQLNETDVVRHKLVKSIIEAYQKTD